MTDDTRVCLLTFLRRPSLPDRLVVETVAQAEEATDAIQSLLTGDEARLALMFFPVYLKGWLDCLKYVRG